MTAPPRSPDKRILQEAAQWFAVLHFGDAREEDRARWRAWLGMPGSAQHAAWRRVEAISGRFGAAAELPGRFALHARGGASRRKALGALAALGGSAAAAWMGSRTQAWESMRADLSTATGEIREQTLADGTRIWLNTASAIDVRYGVRERRVRLLHGEVHVATAPDPGRAGPRPFYLDTAHARLRPLGTRFTVRQGRETSLLSVEAGAVEIAPAGGGAAKVVEAGRRARFSASGVDAPGPLTGVAHGWTRGVLVVQDVRLDDFLAELGRYRRGRLGCDPDVAGLRLAGVYSVRDTDHALAALEHALPVEVRRYAPWWVMVGSTPTR
ncbi:FecR domain-containing protein [Pigmentiphaga humi]|uniref:FecR domain-containing protein n=1 Tax=Pigmentiphaga humi TaxID=2478468 RepID=UPI001357F8BE|nr:FecR domain-containing protein [Pigmentiphaga humi]